MRSKAVRLGSHLEGFQLKGELHKRRILWRLGAIVVGMVLAGAVAGCGGASAAASNSRLNLVNPGYLTIGVYGSYPPALSYSGNRLGAIEGILFNTFAKEHHLKVKLYETSFASLILATQEHKVDVGLYFYYSAARSKTVRYTVPFLYDTNKLWTRKGFDYTGPSSIKTIGSVTGFAAVPYLQKEFGSNLQLYSSDATEGAALINGQVDGIIQGWAGVDAPPLTKANSVVRTLKPGTFDLPGSLLSTADYNITACKDTGLARALDTETRTLVKDGTWRTDVKKLGLAPYALNLSTPTERCP